MYCLLLLSIYKSNFFFETIAENLLFNKQQVENQKNYIFMNYNNNIDREYIEGKNIQIIINLLKDKNISFSKLSTHSNKVNPYNIPSDVWNQISTDSRLTPTFLTKYQNHINWKHLSQYFNFQNDDNNILFSQIFLQRCNLNALINNKSIIYTPHPCMWGFTITINYD